MSQVDKDREEWGRVKEWPQALGTTPMERCSVCLSLESVSWSGGTYGTLGLGHRKRGGFCFVPWNSREPGAVCEKSDYPEA